MVEHPRQARIKYPVFKMPKASISDLLAQVKDLPTAEKVKAFVKDAGEMKEAKGFEAIITRPNNRVAAMLSKRYEIVQHKDAFSPLLKTVNLFSPDIRGQVMQDDDGKRAYLFVSLPDKFSFKAGDGHELTFGFSAVNSYDGTTGVHIGAFGYRVVCGNGMIMKKMLGAWSFQHIKGVEGRLKQILKGLELNLATVSERIEQAREMQIEAQFAEAYAVKTTGRYTATDIMKIYEGNEKSLWGFYNAFTHIFSEATSNPFRRLTQLAKAERILTEPKAVIQEGKEFNEYLIEVAEIKERNKK